MEKVYMMNGKKGKKQQEQYQIIVRLYEPAEISDLKKKLYNVYSTWLNNSRMDQEEISSQTKGAENE